MKSLLIFLICFCSFNALAKAPVFNTNLSPLFLNSVRSNDLLDGNHYGNAISMSNKTLVVGDYNALCNDSGPCGAAFIYELNPNNNQYELALKLYETDTQGSDRFGQAVDIQDNTLIVSAPRKGRKGAVYVYEKPQGSSWSEAVKVAKLSVNDISTNADFGRVIALYDNNIIAAAPFETVNGEIKAGSAYIFSKLSGGWSNTYSAKLNSSTIRENSAFGSSVAINNKYAAVGSLNDDKVYLFNKNGLWNGSITETTQLQDKPDDTSYLNFFGSSLAFSDDILFVGAYSSKYFYMFDITEFDQPLENEKIKFKALASNNRIGRNISLKGDILLVSAAQSEQHGVSYVFKKPSTGWQDLQQISKFIAHDAQDNMRFSTNVATDGKYISIGARENAIAIGSVYTYDSSFILPAIENKKLINIKTSDPQGQAITHSIVGGQDAALFNINATNGQLSFKNNADFEVPHDNNLDNKYEVTIKLQNTDNQSINKNFHISIFDEEDENAHRVNYSYKKLQQLVNQDSEIFAVAMSKNTAAIAIRSTYSSYINVYEYNSKNHLFEYKAVLTPTIRQTQDFFGFSIDISNDTIVAGSYKFDVNGRFSGSAYVFEKPLTGWEDSNENAMLTPPISSSAQYYGYSVAISGQTIVVGAYLDKGQDGAAYVYERPITGWATTSTAAELTVLEPTNFADRLGYSVDISGDTIILGAPRHGDNSSYWGTVFVYEKTTDTWQDSTESAQLKARSDGTPIEGFSENIAISNNTIVVGASVDDFKKTDSGSIYIFEKPLTGQWQDAFEDVQLSSPQPSISAKFGSSVAISSDTIVVGALEMDNPKAVSGATYIFQRDKLGNWSNNSQYKTTPSSIEAGDQFGKSVAVYGSNVLAAARTPSEAYIYKDSANNNNNIPVLMFLLD